MPFLSRALELNPDGLALRTPDGSLTYRDLAEKAGELARVLKGAGVSPGMTVGVDATMGPGLVASLHAIWGLGAVVAPLNPRWTPAERERAVGLLRPALLVGVDGAVEASGAAEGEAGRDRDRDHREGAVRRYDPASTHDRSSFAARLLTSGTAGAPRVVAITVDNLLANARASRERLDLLPGDRWLASLSPAHVGGLALVTRAACLGSALVVAGEFSPGGFLEMAEAGEVTHASLVPTMLRRLLAESGGNPAPRGLRALLVGGAATSPEVLHDSLEAGFPVALTYGLTQATSQVATASPALVRDKPGTVGFPLPGVEVRLSGEGELLVKGETVAPRCAARDGWLRTGDRARLDEDGHLWITGRLSDRIISGGVNVDPAEVEALLRSHPRILEAAVVGIPDPEWGERVVALVVPAAGGELVEEELQILARDALSAAKRPRAYRLSPVLPLNPNGKVDREVVRALFGEAGEEGR